MNCTYVIWAHPYCRWIVTILISLGNNDEEVPINIVVSLRTWNNVRGSIILTFPGVLILVLSPRKSHTIPGDRELVTGYYLRSKHEAWHMVRYGWFECVYGIQSWAGKRVCSFLLVLKYFLKRFVKDHMISMKIQQVWRTFMKSYFPWGVLWSIP